MGQVVGAYPEPDFDYWEMPEEQGPPEPPGYSFPKPLPETPEPEEPDRPKIPGDGDTGEFGDGGGASYVPPTVDTSVDEVGWSESYSVEGAPDWWRGFIPPDVKDEKSEFLSIMNSMIPFMSVEDQREAASLLGREMPDVFSEYNDPDIEFGDIPFNITSDLKDRFTSVSRASDALDALANMRSAAGYSDDDSGTGVTFIRQLLDVLKDFGGTADNRQSRLDYVQQQQALNPLIGDAQGYYQTLANMLSAPTFSAGKLTPGRVVNGKYIFGEANPRFF